jgi:hypothetical protein
MMLSVWRMKAYVGKRREIRYIGESLCPVKLKTQISW